ncbi:hypothetical protein HDC94_001606 [Leifsonia sp. AK011]|uniref:nuclease-related domain-containing protein n=1 Tax=Leifsonia sp. AK011 TaxID=2723075 RepID=UPI0015CD22AE|nr:nuclease-related domain-containing protein [Leifsonia sp. AK011]NYF10450.1 hypothetical protein [Leifsonia sp. AK011]
MSVGRAVRDRIAAQSAMADVVDRQRDAPPRGALPRLIGLSPLLPASRASYRDALAELVVGDILENLGQNWDVLHDVPLGDATLDHLLIGPAGTFAVRAAHYGERDVVITGDEVSVGSERPLDLAEAVTQAATAAERLSDVAKQPVIVTPVLVVVAPRRLVIRVAPGSVEVMTANELGRYFARSPRALSGTEVAAISDLADLESTWDTPASESLEVQGLHSSFSLIREEVRAARARRLVLGGIAAGVGLIALWTFVAQATSMLLAF